jgi:hypothetical protein
MEPADIDSTWGPEALPTSRRVGVPGGEQKTSIFRWHGSVWQYVTNWAVLAQMIMYIFEVFVYSRINVGKYDDAKFDPQIMSALTYIVTFSLGTYLSTILGRYHERFNNCCQTNGNMTLLSLICGAELKDNVQEAATILRWGNLMMHMYYMMVEGKLTDRKWAILKERGLVTEEEIAELMPLKKKPSAVYVWTCRLIHELCQKDKLSIVHAQRLEACLSGCRGLAAKQIAYQLCPIPMPYFHLMMVIVNVYILLMGWNSAIRLVSGVDEALHLPDDKMLELFWAGGTEMVGFGFVIIFFNVMQHIAEDMTDPYSNDATDYHLDFDLINLWDESKETIENMVAGGNDLAAKMIQASAKAHSPGEPIRAAVRRQPGAADAKKRSAVGQLL